MSKVLSVVVPSYNASEFLKEDIPSFIDPRIINDIEIIIVNDGSKDETLVTARKFCAEYPETIICIDKENGGHGSTINAGAKVATGKYFKVVDADDWVDTEAFVDFVRYLEQVDTDMIVAPYNAVYIDSGEKVTHCDYSNCFQQGESYVFDAIAERLTEYAMHSLTFKTDIIKKQKAISEHCFYVDMEYICNPIKDIGTVSFFHKSVYQYRLGSAEQSVSLANRQKNRAMQRKVTNNVLNLLENTDMSSEKRKFLENISGRLIVQQTDILLSFKPSADIKNELIEFYDEVNAHTPYIWKSIRGKKVVILKKAGFWIYAPLAILVRATKTYH